MSRKLIILSAPSGAGKTSLCAKLLIEFQDKLILSVSTTTRPPRGKEKQGVDYFFVSREEFELGIKNENFAEWALVHGNYYGTSKKTIEDTFQKDKSVLLDIDVQGTESLCRVYPEESVSIFIAPPSLKVLEERLRNRNTDSEETIQKRMKNAEIEMKAIPDFKHVIINDTFDHAYQELVRIVQMYLKGKNG